MDIKTKAIVLHCVKYGESQLIVDLLTRETGRTTVICHLSRQGRGKYKIQMFQPLTLLDCDIDQRPTRNMQRFRDVRFDIPYATICTDPVKASIALFLSEFLIYATRDEQQNETLFDYVEQSFVWLDNKDSHYANFHLVFMMRLTRFIGFYPNLEHGYEGEWFDLRNGDFSAVRPPHPDCLGPREAASVKLLMRMNYDNMHLFHFSQAERNRCLEIILYYYRLHIPNFPELKSLEVLHAVFNS